MKSIDYQQLVPDTVELAQRPIARAGTNIGRRDRHRPARHNLSLAINKARNLAIATDRASAVHTIRRGHLQ